MRLISVVHVSIFANLSLLLKIFSQLHNCISISTAQEISRPNVFNNSGPFCGGIFLDRPLIHHSRQVNGFMGMGVGNGQMMIAEREGRCDYEDPCVSTLTCVESNAQHNQDNYFYNSNPYPLGHGHYRRSLSAESVADSTSTSSLSLGCLYPFRVFELCHCFVAFQITG